MENIIAFILCWMLGFIVGSLCTLWFTVRIMKKVVD